MAQTFSFEAAGVPVSASPVGFRGRETLGRPFSLEVFLRSTEVELDHEAIVGGKASLVVPPRRIDGDPSRWQGVVADVELVHAEEGWSLWRLTVVPRLWRLSLTMHSRVFTSMSIPEIVEAVLLDEGLSGSDFRFELRTEYPTLEHVTQFRESSLDFISRLLEREGIYYRFDHGEETEQVVFLDDLSSSPLAREAAVPFHPLSEGDFMVSEGLFVFAYEHRALASEVRVTDYDHLFPSARPSSTSSVQRGAPSVVVEHGEFVSTPGEEVRYANVRAEEHLAREQVFRGVGVVHELRAGLLFQLANHPHRPYDAEYLVTTLEVEGVASSVGVSSAITALAGLEGKGGVTVEIEAIPASVQFRPQRLTAWPRIHGVVDATVDGMGESEYAQLDSLGRYNVRLRFDEGQTKAGQSSTRVRMLQPHGGSTEGFHFPLRKGTEVQVAFLAGDPDRPVIVAAAPNAVERSVVRASNNTKNNIHTGGGNDLVMEDVAGGQYVTMFTPPQASTLHLGAGGNQFELRTDGQGHVHIGETLDIDVFGAKIETVASSLTETYVGLQKLEVLGPVSRTYRTLQHQTVTGPVTESVTGTLVEAVTAAVEESYQAGQATTVDAALTDITYGATLTQTVNGGLLQETIASSRTRILASTWTHAVSAHVSETFGPTVRLVAGDFVETAGGTVTINVPQMKIIATERTWIDTGIMLIETYKDITDALHLWLTQDKVSITGVSLSAVGADLTLTGETTALAASIRLGMKATEQSTAPKKYDKFALGVWTKGADMSFKGIFIIQ